MSTSRTIATSLSACALAVLGLAAAGAPAAASATTVDTGRQPLISYNATFVPAAATARVREIATASGATIVTLQVRGLAPNREYGAHAHRFACSTTDPLAAGGHFQYGVDPVQPSTDPAFANPANEIWLDLTTDAQGSAAAQALVRWQFPADRRPRSVILHDHHTASGTAGTAGTAGPRYGCLTVAF